MWRERIWLVRMYVRLKNRIHRLLNHYHVEVPEFSDLFGSAGRRFLEELELPDPGNRILKAQLKLLESYRSQIQEVQRWAVQATRNHPYRVYLESLPGFGKVFAPIVALEIDDPKRFANPGKLASYCGLVPSPLQLGWKILARRYWQRGQSLAEVGLYRSRLGGDPSISLLSRALPTTARTQDRPSGDCRLRQAFM